VHSKQPAPSDWRRKRPTQEEQAIIPDFGSGRQLRDYQQESLRWMVGNWMQGKNCILGDEVGSCLHLRRRLGLGTSSHLCIKAARTGRGAWLGHCNTDMPGQSGGQAWEPDHSRCR
jgi:hypothetical protein